jgi:hypothetical protein
LAAVPPTSDAILMLLRREEKHILPLSIFLCKKTHAAYLTRATFSYFSRSAFFLERDAILGC